MYVDSGKICVAGDELSYSDVSAIDHAVNSLAEFIRNEGGVHHYPGVISSGTVDVMEAQEEYDEAYLSQKWEELEVEAGEELADALRMLYQLYDDKLADWFANLYDPGTGGFYAAASGRDNIGFGPDVQSTSQIISALESSGMFASMNNDAALALPDWMKAQIVRFIKGLQDENGYFYHPQWGKEFTDKYYTRRGRDLGFATGLLKQFGASPTYDTPNGYAGDGLDADGNPISSAIASPAYLTSRLGSSVATAVSRVVTASSTDYLSSHEAFYQYLRAEVDVDVRPYNAGNIVNAIYSQVASSSKKLGKFTADSSKPYYNQTLNEMLIEYLNSKINPDIGLWGTPKNGQTGTEFEFTNGFFKIISVYNSIGVAYPYPEAAANALLEGLLGDEPSETNPCDIYNVWSAIGYLKTNVNNYVADKSLKTELLSSVNSVIEEKGADAVLNTYNKIKGYKRSDGAFSHTYTSNIASHQNHPIAISGIVESDVDSTCIASTGLLKRMFSALGVTMIPIFTTSDYLRFISTVEELDPVIKYSYSGDALGLYSFTNMPTDNYLRFSNGGNTANTLTIADHENESVLFYDKNASGSSAQISFYANATSVSANKFIFETELCITSVTGNSMIEIIIMPKNANNPDRVYRLLLMSKETANGSMIYCYDSNNVITETGALLGDWFTLRIEYYEGNTECHGPSARMITSVNGTVIGVSATPYGSLQPAQKVNCVSFAPSAAFVGDIYFDNMRVTQTVESFEDVALTWGTAPEEEGAAPNEPTDTTSEIEDGKLTFTTANTLPVTAENGLVVKNESKQGFWGRIVVANDGENRFLRINDPRGAFSSTGDSSDDSGQAIARITRNTSSKTGDTVSFVAKVRFSAVNNNFSSASIDFSLRANKVRAVRCYLSVNSEGTVLANINGTAGASDKTTAKFGEWFTLRIEYHSAAEGQLEVRLYVNNVLVKTATTTKETYASTSAIDDLSIYPSMAHVGCIDIDDIVFTQQNGSTSGNDPESSENGGDVVLPDPPSVPDTPVIPDTSGSDVENGKLTFSGMSKFPTTSSNGITVKNNTQSNFLGEVDIDSEGENSFLRISDVSAEDSGQAIVRFERSTSGVAGNIFVYEADMRFGEIDGQFSGSSVDISLRASATRVIRLYISGGDGDLKVNFNGAPTDSNKTGILPTEWFTLRIELEEKSDGSFEARAYVNGSLVRTATTTKETYASPSAITDVSIIPSKTCLHTLDIDNVLISQES